MDRLPACRPMYDIYRKACNLNDDKLCDKADIQFFMQSMGQCREVGHFRYNSMADADKDGCVTDVDKEMLFKSFVSDDYSIPGYHVKDFVLINGL